ncbi:MAG TPA: dehydratase [Anaerolineaceae bacterium]|nr:dehydratase [Anaerolineales bacterium]HIQ07977.1 dehydratase [Anaerolineaceae bacterium]
MDTYQPRGMYFEDFKEGMRFVTAGRTVTEADVVRFAALSGDYNPLHTDAEYAKRTPFGARIAHGLLVTSMVTGLVDRTGMLEGTTLAFREINEWKFIRPVYLGDTIHAVLEVEQTRPLRRLGGGAVTIRVEVRNQKDETVMKGRWTVLMLSREAGATA